MKASYPFFILDSRTKNKLIPAPGDTASPDLPRAGLRELLMRRAMP